MPEIYIEGLPRIYIEGLPELHIDVVDPGYAPTCGKAGCTDGTRCIICGRSYSGRYLPPTEQHTLVTDEPIAPTCTESGLLVGVHCKDCGTILQKQEVIPAAGHNFVYYNNRIFCNRCLLENDAIGLEYQLNPNKKSYTVVGIGTYAGNIVVIPSTYNNLPVTGIGERAFYRCYDITSIILPDSITFIGNYAFTYCSKLTSITLSNSITTIGQYAFYDCRLLTSLVIPNSVKIISEGTFSECIGLTNVTLSNDITDIATRAFYNCKSLTKINFNGTTSQWDAIAKPISWNENTGSYTIHCTDGEITKSGIVTYY